LLKRDSPFRILRKPPDKLLAMRRIVYDNDHPAHDLAGRTPPRWAPAEHSSGWRATDAGVLQNDGAGDAIDWLRYRHLLRENSRPELITDFVGYNSKSHDGRHVVEPRNWVGDLMLECDVAIDKMQGQLVMELSKGEDRFRAVWDLSSADGSCTLLRITGSQERKLGTRPTAIRKPGSRRIRFANIDDRVLVWVDDSLPFGDGMEYVASAKTGPYANDLEPASIGLSQGGGAAIRHLKLWRDTYYTRQPGGEPHDADFYGALAPPDDFTAEQREKWLESRERLETPEGWSDPDAWLPLRHLPGHTMYVQPGHYLCMGDNSPESSDGRSWGLVPARLLLGRALLVYWPVQNPLPIISSPVTRFGPIR
jgi:signal peptidase I